MKCLFVDTSGSQGLIATFDEKGAGSLFQFPESKNLFSNLLAVLSKEEILPKEIDHFFVGAGPGSYTGIRIGVAAMQVMAFALGKEVILIDSLKLFYAGVPVLLDARRGGFYIFDGSKSKILSEEDFVSNRAPMTSFCSPKTFPLESRLHSLGFFGPLLEVKASLEKVRAVCLEALACQNERVDAILYLKKTEPERKIEGNP